MNILVIGSGGREHALAWKLNNDGHQVYVAPGNPGTALEPGVNNVPIGVGELDALLGFAQKHAIQLTIVGPEAPLVAGIVDRFEAAGLACLGPRQQAAQLEGSKAFCKAFLQRHGIPTAHYGSFSEVAPAMAFLQQLGRPVVVKADGLAAGKGVILTDDAAQAQAALEQLLVQGSLGEAGQQVVVEERLSGEELSFIALVDGEHILALASSQDHKARDNGDQGPNTGGMGAYSPAPLMDEALQQRIMAEVMLPTVQGMAAEGNPYRGFLYAGLMIGEDGVPRVLEFNCRLGDPETQPLMMRLHSDLGALCLAACQGNLEQLRTIWDPRTALGVVLTAAGYPGAYRQGDVISGLTEPLGPGCKVFHAGTAQRETGELVTQGGRVVCATALGDSALEAQRAAYDVARRIAWEGIYYRTDIGHRAVARERHLD